MVHLVQPLRPSVFSPWGLSPLNGDRERQIIMAIRATARDLVSHRKRAARGDNTSTIFEPHGAMKQTYTRDQFNTSDKVHLHTFNKEALTSSHDDFMKLIQTPN